MIGLWNSLKAKFEANAPRERVLLLAAFIAAIYFIWDTFFILPEQKNRQLLNTKIEAQGRSIIQLNAQVQVLSRLTNKDSGNGSKQEIKTLEASLKKLDAQLDEASVGLIPTKKLALMLHDVLRANQSLELQNVKTLPVEPLVLGADQYLLERSGQAAVVVQEAQAPLLYRQGLSLQFKGQYSEVLSYLVALESIPWTFYWDQLSYRVTNDPLAEISIRVFTLSDGPGVFSDE